MDKQARHLKADAEAEAEAKAAYLAQQDEEKKTACEKS